MEQNYLPHEEFYNELKRLQAENYHLKKQLKNKNNTIKAKTRKMRQMKRRLDKLVGDKPQYKNKPRGRV